MSRRMLVALMCLAGCLIAVAGCHSAKPGPPTGSTASSGSLSGGRGSGGGMGSGGGGMSGGMRSGGGTGSGGR